MPSSLARMRALPSASLCAAGHPPFEAASAVQTYAKVVWLASGLDEWFFLRSEWRLEVWGGSGHTGGASFSLLPATSPAACAVLTLPARRCELRQRADSPAASIPPPCRVKPRCSAPTLQVMRGISKIAMPVTSGPNSTTCHATHARSYN